MKLKWRLLIPDWGHLDELWKNPDPFCLWPVGNQPFIAHWMDRAVVENIENVEIYVADRPSAVRDYLNGGAYWSRNVSVFPIRSDEKAPSDAVPVIGLPRENKVHSELENPSDLFQHWLHLNKSWVQKIKEYELRIETPIGNGGWVGPQTRISPSAKLVPPFWIQGKCDVGSNTVIGPNTCIGENTIIDDNAIVRDSIVLPGTMVGRNTQLDQVAADGGLLIDVKRGCRINILDAFILSDLGNRIRKAPLAERLFAILLFTLAAPIVALSKMDWTTIEAHDGKGGALALKTGKSGCLLAKRWHWLKEVFKGRMRLIGILPRPIEWKIEENQELEQRLREASPGFLSLSDLHDCHSADDPNEWVHASYQVLGRDKNIIKLVRNSFWKLAFKRSA
jgi:hypothetical protein